MASMGPQPPPMAYPPPNPFMQAGQQGFHPPPPYVYSNPAYPPPPGAGPGSGGFAAPATPAYAPTSSGPWSSCAGFATNVISWRAVRVISDLITLASPLPHAISYEQSFSLFSFFLNCCCCCCFVDSVIYNRQYRTRRSKNTVLVNRGREITCACYKGK